MSETLQYVRKNRGQVAKDVSALLSVKNITEIRILKTESWIYVYTGHPVVVRILPNLGKEDYDRVLRSAKEYPNCNPDDTVFLLDVLKICAEKMSVI